MKILYISCHAILEYDEVKMLHELGYDVFSAGVYAYPKWRAGMPRPGIDTLTHYVDLERLASTIDSSGGAIPQPLIDWADTIIFMHRPEWLEKNWPKLKHKRVIFRSIGQNVPHTERLLTPLVAEGLQIIRYSPNERSYPNFAGEDTLIRFYKDPEEYNGFSGVNAQVINISQSIKQRSEFCHYPEVADLLNGYAHKIYGIGNEDLGKEWGGELDFEGLKQVMRENRVYVYAGTWPACYTLSFTEALMTGIPVVALGSLYTENGRFEKLSFYEIPNIIHHGENGYVSDNLAELKTIIGDLLQNQKRAMEVGRQGRARAIELFGKEKIALEWKAFLG